MRPEYLRNVAIFPRLLVLGNMCFGVPGRWAFFESNRLTYISNHNSLLYYIALFSIPLFEFLITIFIASKVLQNNKDVSYSGSVFSWHIRRFHPAWLVMTLLLMLLTTWIDLNFIFYFFPLYIGKLTILGAYSVITWIVVIFGLLIGQFDIYLQERNDSKLLASNAELTLRESSIKLKELEFAALTARAALVASQISPHVLHNMLAKSIAMLHTSKIEYVEAYLEASSKYLRLVIDAATNASVVIGVEFNVIREYLKLSEFLLNNDTVVKLEIDPDLTNCCIPPLLVQPLIENAVIHGLVPVRNTISTQLDVTAKRVNRAVIIEISNNGIPYVQGREGVGLSSIRERLALTYPGDDRARLEISHSNGWTTAILSCPVEEVECESWS